MKVLVVDDELVHRRGIISNVDWDGLGLQLVGEASDGASGLEMVKEKKPDIVISDVRMPNMNGIEMAQKAKEISPNLKVIYVSGYDDFEYLTGAIRVSADEYLLKPAKKEELSKILSRTISICQKEFAAQRANMELRRKLKESMPLLKERFVWDLLSGSISENKIAGRMEYLQLEAGHPPYTVLIISLTRQTFVKIDLEIEETEIDRYLLLQILQNEADLKGRMLYAYYGDDKLVVIIGAMKPEQSVTDINIEMLTNQVICQYMDNNIDVRVGVGNPVQKLSHVRFSFRQARQALESGARSSMGKVFYQSDFGGDSPDDVVDYDEVEHKLLGYIRGGQAEKGLEYANQFMNKLSKEQQLPFGCKRSLCLSLLLAIERVLLLLLGNDFKFAECVRRTREAFELCNNMEDISREFIGFCRSVFRLVNAAYKKKENQAVEQVKEIINKRYNTNITLIDASKEIFLTPHYLGALFKQETGLSFNEYLTNVRMEKAREAILSTDMPVYQISQAVGYTNVSYFCSVFRNKYGLSPRAFKEQYSLGR